MNWPFRLLLITGLLFLSCNKNDEHNDAGQVIVKGTNKLIVTVTHHTYNLPDIEVYLKYNTTTFPGTDTSLYDWNTRSDPSGIAVFDNMFQGNYFLYAKGFDTGIGENVIGASPVVLSSTTLVNNELYITLFVTE